MSTVSVRRPPRRPAPSIPGGELRVEAPPELPRATGGRWQQLMLLLPMLGGGVAMAMMMGRGGGAFSYVVGGMFGISSLAMLATSWGYGGPRKAELVAARRDYLRHLSLLRGQARATVARQRTGLFYRHPDPSRLWSTVDSHRLWERRPADSDFAVVRVGIGPQSLATALVPPVSRPPDDLEPMTAGALRRFLDAYSVVPDLPVALSMRGFARVHVRGSPALVRALLAQLVTFHAPDDLVVAVAAGPGRRADWEWVKWLPHARHPARSDALGPVRLVADTVAGLERLLDGISAHLVVVVDGAGPARFSGTDGLTVVEVDGTPPRLVDPSTVVLTRRPDGTLETTTTDGVAVVGVADGLDVASASALARRLAPLRLAGPAGGSPLPAADVGLLGVAEPDAWTVAEGWAPRPPRDQLRVPIGAAGDGSPVELDLKESALDGMGPHGLLIGATGSGKSELLRTLVLGLAATHSSEDLNVVLVDFKGGATFASLDRLPHTAALITNLADELHLVDRMVDAVNGELIRRQELLRRAGNYASRRDYEQARAAGAPLAPLPSLLVVCDEFSELLSAKPDFIDLFVQIGRLGRSLGVHLLLASQRLEEGRLRGLDTHLSYRIGLRTFSPFESRAVLGVPDAYELPRAPGHAYLKAGTDPLRRFRVAYVSGPVRPAPAPSTGPLVLPFTTSPLLSSPAVPAPGGPSLLDALVDRIAGQGPPAHRVWLPPLASPATFDEVLGPPVVVPGRGLTFANPELHGALQVPVAVVDRPLDQRRDLLWFALDGAAGHVAVVGAPRSGKSTALRTLVCGLALAHTPAEARFYCLDFGGGTLATLRDLPHVGGVAGRLDPAAVRRTVGELGTLLASREGCASSGEPHVFLVVDGWSTLRSEFDDLEPVVTDLAGRGLAYGIHVLASANRWLDLRPATRDLFAARLELRLGDPSDSVISRQAAAGVPADSPGRGITSEGLHLLTLSPALTGDVPLAKAVAAAWAGPPAPPVRLLPPAVPYADLDQTATTGLTLPIGIAEADLGPVAVDFAADPHFVLFGDQECGKTSFLRALAATVTHRFTPSQARLIVVDYRRSLLGAVETDHLIGYGTAAGDTSELIESVAGYMRRRLPPPDVTPAQLHARSWWTGPELFVLVDDYDLVAAAPANPLLALVEFLPQARDIGLHLVLTRRTGGAARALYDPIVQRLRELATAGLVMSGDADEGPLVGSVRPGPLPAGRGRLVTRKTGTRLVQLAHLPAP
ncbi:type VII secretion protein EccC [Asanoa ishikariensis]|uniref:DNA segregation ATPase FtsK/SpoIIIE, S-DNA-T family n=1 Tax=Asanoa ishikariensis TaxID=137265 RepID=A0A1H3UVY3_9ACTN|nr:type VII secretion protein EccCa [Asanoa ishikariensis]GIF65147.1 type VII secretion protein EccC [Asanoa ishikariensis]SDZ66416.1 DNA segregation ATPase FtsK/SpoIIIE, S-DNA-T family [Asanoa ishikariensis]